MSCPTYLWPYIFHYFKNPKKRQRTPSGKKMTSQKSSLKPTARAKSNSEAGLCLLVFRLASLPYSSFIKSSFSRCPFQILWSCSCNLIKVFLCWCMAWLSVAFLEPWPTDFYHYRRRKCLKIPTIRRKAINDFTIRFSILNQDNQTTPLDAYRGKVLLVVNTATGCGLTPQYQGLQELYDRYQNQGFEIFRSSLAISSCDKHQVVQRK